jgi:hypothetical protein
MIVPKTLRLFFQRLYEGQGFRLSNRVEVGERADERFEHPGRAVAALAEVSGPLRQQREVEMVDRGDFEDDRRIRLADYASLDLREMCVRDARPALHITERQALMQARSLQDCTEDGLRGLGTLGLVLDYGHAQRVPILEGARVTANDIRKNAKMLR